MMRLLSNVKLQAKLLSAFAVLTLLIGGTGVAGLYFVGEIDRTRADGGI